MRIIVRVLTTFAAFCLGGAVVWVFGPRLGLTHAPTGPEKTPPERAQEGRMEENPEWIHRLPVKMAFAGKRFFPCYVDPAGKTIYRWNCVDLGFEQLPEAYASVPSRLTTLDAAEFSEVVAVDPLVRYREENGDYYPGYYFAPTHTFFQWRHTKLAREKVIPRRWGNGQNSVLELDAVSEIIVIDMPEHLKDQPGLWRSP